MSTVTIDATQLGRLALAVEMAALEIAHHYRDRGCLPLGYRSVIEKRRDAYLAAQAALGAEPFAPTIADFDAILALPDEAAS